MIQTISSSSSVGRPNPDVMRQIEDDYQAKKKKERPDGDCTAAAYPVEEPELVEAA